VRRSGLRQQAGPAFLARAVAVAADGDDLAVVEQPVEDVVDIGDHFVEDGAHDAVAGAAQTARRFMPSVAASIAARIDGLEAAAPCAAILASTSPALGRARFHRASSSAATSRFAGSAASCCRNARSAP
jgi:hypothetical protein